MLKYILGAIVIGGGGYAAYRSGLFSKKKPVVNNRGRIDIKKLPKPKDVVKQTRDVTKNVAQLMITPGSEEVSRPKIVSTGTTPKPSPGSSSASQAGGAAASSAVSGILNKIPRAVVKPKPATSALMSQKRSFNKYYAKYGD